MALATFDWEKVERDNSRKSKVITTIVMLLLLLLLWFLGLYRENPPPGERGISVVFGNTDVGQGNEVPTSTEQEETATPPVEEEIIEEEVVEEQPPTEPVVEDVVPTEEVVTQDVEEAPVIKNEPVTKPVTEPVKEPVKEEPVTEPVTEPVKEPVKETPKPKPTPKPGSTFGGFQSDANNPGSNGDDNVDGTKGEYTGDPDGNNWKGDNEGLGDFEGGKGDWYLGGRSLKKKAIPNDDSQKTGVVVVSITVNRSGKVVNATCCTAKGSTTKDPDLVAKAIEAAYKYEFSANSDAPAEQQGFLRFVFKLQ